KGERRRKRERPVRRDRKVVAAVVLQYDGSRQARDCAADGVSHTTAISTTGAGARTTSTAISITTAATRGEEHGDGHKKSPIHAVLLTARTDQTQLGRHQTQLGWLLFRL